MYISLDHRPLGDQDNTHNTHHLLTTIQHALSSNFSTPTLYAPSRATLVNTNVLPCVEVPRFRRAKRQEQVPSLRTDHKGTLSS
jgi:hypothetical protein